jgi:hypothetical protein
MNFRTAFSKGGRKPLLAGAVALAAASLGACDSVLEVEDPDVLRETAVTDSASVGILRNGAFFNLGRAYGGNNSGDDALIVATGWMSDELYNTDSFNTREEYDRRSIAETNASLGTLYRYIQRARLQAETSARGFGQYQSSLTTNTSRSDVLSLAGYSYIFLGENFCSGIPFSETVNGEFQFGQPLPTDSVFRRAVARFDEALSFAGTGSAAAQATARNLAAIGKARALLNLNDPAGAAAAVAAVPSSFVFNLQYLETPAASNNGVWALSLSRKATGVSDREGNVGLPFRSLGSDSSAAGQPGDRRVRYIPNGLGFSTQYYQFAQVLYPTRNSPLPLATGVEARLIGAEAALRAGNVETFRTRLNEARAAVQTGATQPPFSLAPISADSIAALQSAGGAAALQDLLFKERAFSLYLTAHRLGDLRRLVRQYGRTPNSVFPTNPRILPFRRNATTGVVTFAQYPNYGTDVNFPVPFDERNNPQFNGCLNRDA